MPALTSLQQQQERKKNINTFLLNRFCLSKLIFKAKDATFTNIKIFLELCVNITS